MTGLVLLLLIGLALAVMLAAWVAASRLRRPPRRTYAWAVARGVPGEPGEMTPARRFDVFDVALDERGTAHADGPRPRGAAVARCWEIAGADPLGPIVVCTPGWGDSKLGVLARLRGLEARASRVIAWDPPGLGDTPGLCALGTPSDVAALERVVGAALARAPGPEQRVVLFGWSLGAGVSIAAAVRLGAGVMGVIAEAPYREAPTPARNVMHAAGLPWRATLPMVFAVLGVRLGVGPRWRGFDRATLARSLPCPLLVYHGTDDAICPPDDGRRIASSAQHGLWVPIEGAGHNDLWTAPAFAVQCEHAIADFLGALAPGALPVASAAPPASPAP